jgi:uroporphyrinogen-III synthase
MRLLVTRPQPEAEALARRLEALGHEAIIEPLVAVELDDKARLSTSGVAAVIATSSNGLRALARRPAALAKLKGQRLYAVGPATARLGAELGFADIVTGPGDAAGLAEVITHTSSPGAGPLLHLAGQDLAFDIADALTRRGLAVVSVVLYRTVPATRLSDATLQALAERRLDGVILMSPRTAATWAGLVSSHGIEDAASVPTHFCLSRSIAGALIALKGLPIRVAGAPDTEELLALVAVAAQE